MRTFAFTTLTTTLLLASAFTFTGCDSAPSDAEPPVSTNAAAGHNHGGWWCSEHGVPEDVCTRCSPKLAAEFQAKGDWCEEHKLPDSQCLVHHPELADKFAAMYKAKEGVDPPKPSE